ncbi:MAG TPA: hypothetical protein VJC03_03670 [bacterium]|nr:hypothetical protein [bacterium]
MELKRVRVSSIWKVLPLLFFSLGVLVGGLSLVTLKSLPGQPPGMMAVGFFGGLLATLIYAIFFAIISTLIMAVVAVLYNLIASWWGGIKVDFTQEQ